jgi:hypothetical protein
MFGDDERRCQQLEQQHVLSSLSRPAPGGNPLSTPPELEWRNVAYFSDAEAKADANG